jgi:SAM-dependent methyltransferase
MSLAIPDDWFVCPVTKQPLERTDGVFRSPRGYVFRKNHQFDFWNFTPEHLEDLNADVWKTWQRLQENGVASYQNDPEHNLGVGKRRDYMTFAEFCNFQGTILDVGVGPQECPTHLQNAGNPEVHFVGIDPLVGAQPRDFSFVQGLGEYLPFRSELFDQVLFVTTLDHCVDPRAALIEAKRVLKNKGEVIVWLGHKDKNAPRPPHSPAWYRDLTVPSGAEDIFHFKRLAPEDAEGFYKDCGLCVTEKVVHTIDPWRMNVFYRLRRV